MRYPDAVRLKPARSRLCDAPVDVILSVLMVLAAVPWSWLPESV